MSKPSAKSPHPSYNVMVSAAIAGLKERSGSSRQAIVKYINSNYDGIGVNCSKMVTKTLKSLKESGKVKEGNGGPFKFALTDAGKAKPEKPKKKPAVKKPTVKKPLKPKKPSAKKPAAKKPAEKKKTPKKSPKKTAKPVAKKSKAKSPGKKTVKKPTPKKAAKKPATKKVAKK